MRLFYFFLLLLSFGDNIFYFILFSIFYWSTSSICEQLAAYPPCLTKSKDQRSEWPRMAENGREWPRMACLHCLPLYPKVCLPIQTDLFLCWGTSRLHYWLEWGGRTCYFSAKCSLCLHSFTSTRSCIPSPLKQPNLSAMN
jgi:hypothetical protein